MGEAWKIDPILFRVQGLDVPASRELVIWLADSGAKGNLLAGFAVIQTESLVLSSCNDLITTVVKADTCDLSCIRRMTRPIRVRPWRRRRCGFDSFLEDLGGLQLAL